jgi:hypothetical protein
MSTKQLGNTGPLHLAVTTFPRSVGLGWKLDCRLTGIKHEVGFRDGGVIKPFPFGFYTLLDATQMNLKSDNRFLMFFEGMSSGDNFLRGG